MRFDQAGSCTGVVMARTGRVAPDALRPALIGVAFLAGGCSVGPDYVKPTAPVPVLYKELKGWKPATPHDAFDRGTWWGVYKDLTLDRLERQVEISNQTLKASEAGYRLSVAIIKEAQAGLLPTIDGDYDATRSHEGSAASSSRGSTVTTAAATTGGTTTTGTGTGTTTGTTSSTTAVSTGSRGVTFNSVTLEANASWDLDVWGKVRRQIESDVASAQVSDADLANVRLSAQAQLATAYFDLRTEDSLHRLLAETVAAYQRTLEITQNQYAAGTAARSDVDNALAQLKTTQAMEISTGILRAQYEHAVAALVGKVPAELAIGTAPLAASAPVAPVRLPSSLLERRPDIAAAERTMRQQNEAIGVAVAAFYPDISLSATIGAVGRSALPISAANEIWSFGGSLAQPLFDGGLRLADVAAATATYDQGVATYRETVLTAFQQVEDELAALRILARQGAVEDEAVAAARQAVDITLNEYKAGTVAFTSVVTAQATLLGDQETALTIRQNRFIASVALIQALGGGWTVAHLPSADELKAAPTPPTGSPDLKSDVFTPKPHL